ncbi:MAG: anti-CBASS protein Acb1 family protein [Solirubrobacteraceae bacterium]
MSKKRPTTTMARRAAVRDEKAALRARQPKKMPKTARALDAAAADSFQNFGLNLGMGTNNALSGSTFGFNPISRVRTLLEWIYRGTWIGGVAVDLRAEDMTRAGIEINTTMPPRDIKTLQAGLSRLGVWRGIRDTRRWASLYGGAIGVLLIDGHDLAQPLRIEAIAKGSFRGIAVLDRWMVEPTLGRGGLVEELGPDLGKPKFYLVRTDSSMLPGNKIHYSRCLRLVGDDMPYWQAVMENMWGTSVYERIYDRLVAFDSATQGAAQTVYKSYIRTYKIKRLRDIVTGGGAGYQGLLRYVQMMATFQGIEGVTLIDAEDEFAAHAPSIQSGVSEALIQFGQQLCGALKIPAVRLFGMSPSGLNATGDSDWRNYYDGILQDQETDLRMFVDRVVRIQAKSDGLELPDNFGFNFTPLWQMTAQQKAEVAGRKTETVIAARSDGLYGRATALKELQQQAPETGVHTNITSEDIEAAEEEDKMEPPGLESLGGSPGAERPVPEKRGAEAGSSPQSPPEGLPRVPRLRDAGRGRGAGDAALPLVEIGGLPVLIECRRGEERWPGKVWPADYGLIRRTGSTEGADEDMDCFVGPERDALTAYVINHFREDGSFEEHKVMLAYGSASEARRDYIEAYGRGQGQPAHPFTLAALRDWLDAGRFDEPLRRVA